MNDNPLAEVISFKITTHPLISCDIILQRGH